MCSFLWCLKELRFLTTFNSYVFLDTISKYYNTTQYYKGKYWRTFESKWKERFYNPKLFFQSRHWLFLFLFFFFFFFFLYNLNSLRSLSIFFFFFIQSKFSPILVHFFCCFIYYIFFKKTFNLLPAIISSMYCCIGDVKKVDSDDKDMTTR